MLRNIIKLFMITSILSMAIFATTLKEIKERGELRHLGVPYANFVTGSGDGLSVELMKLFANYLGVKYKYVKTNWSTVITDLSGKKYSVYGNDIKILSDAPIRGDIISNGLTILPWRQKLINYSSPTFPSQVWLIVRANSFIKPIVTVGEAQDIRETKILLEKLKTILSKNGTCLDPTLYGIENKVNKTINFKGSVNDLAPAIIKGEAESTLLEIPDILMALQKWPGKIKVIGPISETQEMGVAFSKDSIELKKAFDKFFTQIKKNGIYAKLVKKYYQSVFEYYPRFFKEQGVLH